MGGPDQLFDDLTTGKNPHKAWSKLSNIKNPSPSSALVFIDESEYVIDDGYFIVNAFSPNTWQNYPSSRHGGAGDMSFADGHSEVRKWKGSSVPKYRNPAGNVTINPSDPKDKVDLEWVQRKFVEEDIRL